MRAYESTFAVTVGGALGLESARRFTHDHVIATTGRARRSGVKWSYLPAATAERELAEDAIHLPETMKRLCAQMPDETLVMATVEIDTDVAP